MKKYEVQITYSGSNTYFVEARSKKHAEEIAKERYLSGDSGDMTGAESEEIERIVSGIMSS